MKAVTQMRGTLYENVSALINQYNGMLAEHGIALAIQQRSFKEDVEAFNPYSQHSLFNLLEYILINKRIEEKKYHHIPNHYKLLILQVNPITKPTASKKNYKKYAFLIYQLSRSHQGQEPLEWQHKEQSVMKRVEKRLKTLLKQAEKSTSVRWCNDTLWDALRYSASKKYEYLENYCGRSRYFWEVFWICVLTLPLLLFAIVGLICSMIH